MDKKHARDPLINAILLVAAGTVIGTLIVTAMMLVTDAASIFDFLKPCGRPW